MVAVAMPALERRLKAARAGEILTSAMARGRYATDASHYQMMPAAVAVPRSMDEAKTFAEAKFVMNGRLKALAFGRCEVDRHQPNLDLSLAQSRRGARKW